MKDQIKVVKLKKILDWFGIYKKVKKLTKIRGKNWHQINVLKFTKNWNALTYQIKVVKKDKKVWNKLTYEI